MILHLDRQSFINTGKAIDISLPLHGGSEAALAWNCPPIQLRPLVTDQFVGDVHQGGTFNCSTLSMVPHGNGTHTECIGHISKEPFTIHQCLKTFHFMAQLISVSPATIYNPTYTVEDAVITADCLQESLQAPSTENIDALIVRTLPNSPSKRTTDYSGTNPAYFSVDAMQLIHHIGIDHLLVDLPSVDREKDEGELRAHHAFWNYPLRPQPQKTLSEMVYVPDDVRDGRYVVNIQIISLESDACPSKIVLYPIETK